MADARGMCSMHIIFLRVDRGELWGRCSKCVVHWQRSCDYERACCLKGRTVCLWTPNTLEGYPRLGKPCLRMIRRSFLKRINMFWYLDSLSTPCMKRSTHAKNLIANIWMLGLNLTFCILLQDPKSLYKLAERVEMIIFYLLLWTNSLVTK